MVSQITVLPVASDTLPDAAACLLDAYRALEGVLFDAGKAPLCDLLHVLNDRLEQVLTSSEVGGGAQ